MSVGDTRSRMRRDDSRPGEWTQGCGAHFRPPFEACRRPGARFRQPRRRPPKMRRMNRRHFASGLLLAALAVGGCPQEEGRAPVARFDITPAYVPLHDGYATVVTLDGTRSKDEIDDPTGALPLGFHWDLDDPAPQVVQGSLGLGPGAGQAAGGMSHRRDPHRAQSVRADCSPHRVRGRDGRLRGGRSRPDWRRAPAKPGRAGGWPAEAGLTPHRALPARRGGLGQTSCPRPRPAWSAAGARGRACAGGSRASSG